MVIRDERVNLVNLSSVRLSCKNCGAYIYVPHDTLLDAGSTFNCSFCLLDTVVNLHYPSQYVAITTLLAQKEKLEQERNELVKLYGEADAERQHLQKRTTQMNSRASLLARLVHDHLIENERFQIELDKLLDSEGA